MSKTLTIFLFSGDVTSTTTTTTASTPAAATAAGSQPGPLGPLIYTSTNTTASDWKKEWSTRQPKISVIQQPPRPILNPNESNISFLNASKNLLDEATHTSPTDNTTSYSIINSLHHPLITPGFHASNNSLRTSAINSISLPPPQHPLITQGFSTADNTSTRPLVIQKAKPQRGSIPIPEKLQVPRDHKTGEILVAFIPENEKVGRLDIDPWELKRYFPATASKFEEINWPITQGMTYKELKKQETNKSHANDLQDIETTKKQSKFDKLLSNAQVSDNKTWSFPESQENLDDPESASERLLNPLPNKPTALFRRRAENKIEIQPRNNWNIAHLGDLVITEVGWERLTDFGCTQWRMNEVIENNNLSNEESSIIIMENTSNFIKSKKTNPPLTTVGQIQKVLCVIMIIRKYIFPSDTSIEPLLMFLIDKRWLADDCNHLSRAEYLATLCSLCEKVLNRNSQYYLSKQDHMDYQSISQYYLTVCPKRSTSRNQGRNNNSSNNTNKNINNTNNSTNNNSGTSQKKTYTMAQIEKFQERLCKNFNMKDPSSNKHRCRNKLNSDGKSCSQGDKTYLHRCSWQYHRGDKSICGQYHGLYEHTSKVTP